MKLTKRAIDSFKYEGTSGSRDVRWDEEVKGLGLRVYPSSKKSFVLSYRAQGRKRLITLGAYGTLTLEKARDEAKLKLGDLIRGKDPLAVRQAAAQGTTMADLCRAYLERHAIHKRSADEDERRINSYILKRWNRAQVASIKRAEVSALHHKIGEKTPYEANRVLALIRVILNKAIEWGFVDERWPNPASGISMHPEHSRERWITPDELPLLAQSIDQESNVYIRSALWLYLLTGARKRELLNARWDDVDFERRELRFGKTKSGRPHHIPLSGPAIAILQSVPKMEGNDYIFPGARQGRPLVNISKAWLRVRERAEVKDARLHDLRRTVGSWLAQAGNDLHLIGKVLNHSQLSTSAVYARFSQDVVREALEGHGQRILEAAGRRGPRGVPGDSGA
jgi:integrase